MSDRQTFVLAHDVAKANAIAAIHALRVGGKRPMTVKIAPQKSQRSLSQNATYWMWMDDIADQCGMSQAEVEAIIRERFVPLTLREMVGKTGQVMRTAIRSTSALTPEQFTALLTKIDAFAAEMGWTLRHPEELHRKREAA